MNKDFVDYVVDRTRKYNFDALMNVITGFSPDDFRRQITKLFLFVCSAAIHRAMDLDEDEIMAIDTLQQIFEAMENIDKPYDSLLVIRAK